MKRKWGGFVIGRRFKKEFRKQLRMIVIITLGFTIAFTWRQTIFDISQSIIQYFFNFNNSVSSSIITSTFITLVSFIIIILTSHLLKDDHKDRFN